MELRMINFILILLSKITPTTEGRALNFVRWLVCEGPFWFVKTLDIEVKSEKGNFVVLDKARILKELESLTDCDESHTLLMVEKLAEINPCTAYITRGPFSITLEIQTQREYSGIIRRRPALWRRHNKNPLRSVWVALTHQAK